MLRYLVFAVLVLAVTGCSLKEKDPELAQKCQRAKDIMATGLPVEEFKPDPLPPLPVDVLDPRGKQDGADIQLAAVADEEPPVIRDQLAEAVSKRGWNTVYANATSPQGAFTVTYLGPNIKGDVTLLPCMDDSLIVFRQQGK